MVRVQQVLDNLEHALKHLKQYPERENDGERAETLRLCKWRIECAVTELKRKGEAPIVPPSIYSRDMII